MLLFVKHARSGFIALSCLASLSLGALGCTPNGESKPEPAPAPAPVVSPPAVDPVAPPQQPAPPKTTAATDEERALASAFIERFLTTIESDSAAGWPALHTAARRNDLAANDAVEQSYEAWRHGTLTAIPFIRKAEFDLQKRGNDFVLRFIGVKVPTDPEVEFSMSVAIEDGEMRISEK